MRYKDQAMQLYQVLYSYHPASVDFNTLTVHLFTHGVLGKEYFAATLNKVTSATIQLIETNGDTTPNPFAACEELKIVVPALSQEQKAEAYAKVQEAYTELYVNTGLTTETMQDLFCYGNAKCIQEVISTVACYADLVDALVPEAIAA
jgi:hypothetical protein